MSLIPMHCFYITQAYPSITCALNKNYGNGNTNTLFWAILASRPIHKARYLISQHKNCKKYLCSRRIDLSNETSQNKIHSQLTIWFGKPFWQKMGNHGFKYILLLILRFYSNVNNIIIS